MDPNGDLLVVERFGIRGISRVARDGSWRQVVLRAADLGIDDVPTGLDIDEGGDLYVAYRNTGSIYRMPSGGTPSLFATIPSSDVTISLCFDPFGDLLAVTPSLATLSLKWNRIGARGMRAVADGLVKNHSLTTLDLSWNVIRTFDGDLLRVSPTLPLTWGWFGRSVALSRR